MLAGARPAWDGDGGGAWGRWVLRAPLGTAPRPALWTKVSVYVRHGALRHENLGSALGPGGLQSNLLSKGFSFPFQMAFTATFRRVCSRLPSHPNLVVPQE